MSSQSHRAKSAQSFLEVLFGERYDWESEHFDDTPKRFAQMLVDLTTPEEFEFTTFASRANEMVVIKDIPFHSMCAHHIVPFIGMCHIAYVPRSTIAGLSKFARLVRHHAADLTVQEELTYNIGRDLEDRLQPQGVAVVMEAEHLCMTIRGVQSPGTTTTTSFMGGVFADHSRQARSEFLSLIGKR